jgi:hypothetical protein
MIDFGTAIPIKRYWEKNKEQPNLGVMEVLEDLGPAMEKTMIIVKDPARDILANYLLEIDRSRRSQDIWPVTSKDKKPLEAERNVAKMINALSSDHVLTTRKAVEEYQVQLSRHGITDATLLNGEKKQGPLYLKLFLLALPAFVGYWLNLPFINITRVTVKKRVKRIEYHSPVLVAMSIGVYTALCLLILLLGLLTGLWWVLLLIPLIFFSGFAYLAYDHYRDQLLQERKRKKVNEYRQQELLKMRLDILHKMMITH